MRMLIRGTTLTVVLMLVVSCSGLLKKKDGDASLEAGAAEMVDAAPVPGPAILATNQGDIQRFPDEVPVASTRVAFQRVYNVREFPPNGRVISGLGKGTVVTQIAVRPPYTLILFDNAAAPGTQLMGWVHRDAFSLSVADAGTLACTTPGEIPLFSDAPYCGKTCATNTDCTADHACTGVSNKLASGNRPGEAVKVCAPVVKPDAGSPTPPPVVPDAGKPAVIDSGIPKIVDAGPKPTPAEPAGDTTAPGTGNSCPNAKWIFVTKTNKCHRRCPAGITGGECKGSPFFCIKCDKDAKKVCSPDRFACGT